MHVCSVPAIQRSTTDAIPAARCWRPRGLRFAILFVGLLAFGQAAAQEAADPAAAPATSKAGPAAKPGKERKVCRNEEVTGSLMKKRICRTPEQWEAQEQAAKEFGRELDAKPVGKDGNI